MMRMLGYAKCPYPAQNSREVLYCNYKARGRVLCVLGSSTMCFDRFLLAVESRDLSQADKSNIRVSSFPKLCDG